MQQLSIKAHWSQGCLIHVAPLPIHFLTSSPDPSSVLPTDNSGECESPLTVWPGTLCCLKNNGGRLWLGDFSHHDTCTGCCQNTSFALQVSVFCHYPTSQRCQFRESLWAFCLGLFSLGEQVLGALNGCMYVFTTHIMHDMLPNSFVRWVMSCLSWLCSTTGRPKCTNGRPYKQHETAFQSLIHICWGRGPWYFERQYQDNYCHWPAIPIFNMKVVVL